MEEVFISNINGLTEKVYKNRGAITKREVLIRDMLIFCEIYDNNRIKIVANYQNHKLHGGVQIFKDGLLEISGQYVIGEKQGMFFYFENNVLIYSQTYERNIRNGLGFAYHTNGMLKSYGRFVNDVKTGIWKNFNERGDMMPNYVHNETFPAQNLQYAETMVSHQASYRNNDSSVYSSSPSSSYGSSSMGPSSSSYGSSSSPSSSYGSSSMGPSSSSSYGSSSSPSSSYGSSSMGPSSSSYGSSSSPSSSYGSSE